MQEFNKINDSITNLDITSPNITVEVRLEENARKQQLLEQEIEDMRKIFQRLPDDLFREFERMTARWKNGRFPDVTQGIQQQLNEENLSSSYLNADGTI